MASATKNQEPICYGQVRGGWQQEWYETASHDAGRRAKVLRAAGYRIAVEGMGSQVTAVGTVKLTMITIFNPDDNVPPVRIERI